MLDLLNRVKAKITPVIGGVVNSLLQSNPLTSQFANINNPITKAATPIVKQGLQTIGQTMQKMPDTTVNLPKLPNVINQAPLDFSKWASSLPGELIRETGRAAEQIGKPRGVQEIFENIPKVPSQVGSGDIDTLFKNPAMIAAIGLANVVPGGGIVPSLSKSAGKTIVKEATKTGLKDVTKKATDLFGKELNWYDKLVQEPYRKFPQLFGENWEKMKRTSPKAIFDKLDFSKASAVDFKNKYTKLIQEAIPFKAGSKESALIQQYGEKKVTKQGLIKQVGEETANQLVQANKTFRKVYDNMLDEINTLRKQAGLKEISKRKDYYRHMQEESKDIFNYLNTFISGGARAERSKGIRAFRKGEKTTYDAVGGFGNYLDKAGQAGFIDTVVPDFKRLRKTLTKNKAPKQLKTELSKYINEQLLGKRKAFSKNKTLNIVVGGMDKIGKTVRMNRVIGNISSLMAQSLNAPVGVADVGIKASFNGILNFNKNMKAVKNLPFVKDRTYRQPLSFARGKIEKGKAFGGAMLQEADLATTKFLGSLYLEKAKLLGKTGDDALKWASDQTRTAMGGRGVGDFSNLQMSRFGASVVPFSLEVQNQANKILGFTSEKGMAKGIQALSTYFILANGMNTFYEKIAGYRPLVDPINAAFDMYKYAHGDEKTKPSWLKVAGRALGEATQLSPIAQNSLAFVYPMMRELFKDGDGNYIIPHPKEVFGSEDPTRFGSVNMYSPGKVGKEGWDWKSMPELASMFTPTGYGAQALKTYEGVKAGIKGYTTSRAGNISHAVPQDALSKTQMGVFGQWSTPESREFFDNEFSRPLTKKQADAIKSLPEEQRPDVIRQMTSQRIDEEKEKYQATPTKSLFEKISSMMSGENKASFGEQAPTTKEGKKAEKAALETLLTTDGVDISNSPNLKRAIITHLLDGTTYDKADRGQKTKILKKLDDIAKSEDYSEETKLAIAEASGVDGNDLEYYRLSSLPQEDRLEMFLDYSSQDFENRSELLVSLALGKRKIGGKVLNPSSLIDRLYDDGTISKEEKSLLTAIKYDPIYDKFYMDRDYKGSGGGLSASKIKSYITSINSLYKSKADADNKTIYASLPKLPEPPKLNLKIKRSRKTSDLLFRPY